MSRDVLSVIFEKNASMLKDIRLSLFKQAQEINKIYGLKISMATLSQLKNGKRYRCGWLLIVTLKHYWKDKGYDFKIE